MATKCHKTGNYCLENWGGMLVFRTVGRKKVYKGKCSRCGREHDLSEKEVNQAIKENS